MSPHELDEPFLPRLPLDPDLREAGRDHAQRAYTRRQRFPRRVEHGVTGQAHDREIDPFAYLGDAAVRQGKV